MWLIENPNNRFLTDPEVVEMAAATLRKSLEGSDLTLVVGNGPSQSAAWYHRIRNPSANLPSISWSDVVKDAAEQIASSHHSKYKRAFLDLCKNNLSLAQAVLVNSPDTRQATSALVDRLEQALSQQLDANALDQAIVSIARRDIITTNYDFQLERAIQKARPSQWRALVRTDVDYQWKENFTCIHKMHGSFAPPQSMREHYRFPGTRDLSQTIVITERDYDRCFKELSSYDAEKYCLFSALRHPSLIIGKMIDPQDISFMFSLRISRTIRNRRFALLTDLPNPDE